MLKKLGFDSKSDLSLVFEGALCDRNAALFTDPVKMPIPPSCRAQLILLIYGNFTIKLRKNLFITSF